MNPWGQILGRWFTKSQVGLKSAGRSLSSPSKKASAVAGLMGGASKAAFVSFSSPRWTGRSYEALSREGFRKNVVVNRCVRILSESAASVPLQLFKGDKPIDKHPLLDLLKTPNPLQSGTELMAGFYAYLEISGNSYLELVLGADGRPGELYVLRPERMKIIPSQNGWPTRFEYKVGAKSHHFVVDTKTGQSPIMHLKGRKIYDPRKDSTNGGSGNHRLNDDTTWEWSDNPALCTVDYLKGVKINGALVAGLGIPDSRIDWPNIIAEANICDETVSLKAGGNEKRYTCNGIINPQNTHRQNLEILTSSMAGTVVFQAGLWRVFAGAPRISIKTRSIDHIVGGVSLKAKKGIGERVNSVKGIYFDEATDFNQKDYPPQQNATYVTEDNNFELWQDLDLPMTTSGTMAQRIAKIALERARLEKQLELQFFPIALQDQAMDTINFSYLPFNISNQKFLIADWALKFEKDENGNIGFLIKEILLEENDSIYSWNHLVDEIDIPATDIATGQLPVNDQRSLPPVNVGGGVVSVSESPLSAVDAGASARIDIAQHDKHFGFGTVSYNSGSISSLSFNTKYYIYADDPNLEGGSVIYLATATITTVTDSNSRIYIGEITTPADGGSSSTGTGGGGITGDVLV